MKVQTERDRLKLLLIHHKELLPIVPPLVLKVSVGIEEKYTDVAHRTEIVNKIRFENFIVDDKLFIKNRIEFLEQQLKRGKIYQSEWFHQFEQFAVDNIKSQIDELTKIIKG